MADGQEQKYQILFAWEMALMYLSLWRTALSVLPLSFNLWANQNDSTIHPVNQKKDRIKDHSLSLLLLRALILQVINMKEIWITGVRNTSMCWVRNYK